MTNHLPVLHAELLALAEPLIDQGVRLIPLKHDKKPFWSLLPKIPVQRKDGTIELKPSWRALMEQGPTTLDQVKYWLDCGISGLGAACGHTWSNGLYVFDVDVPRFFDKWVTGAVAEIFFAHQAPDQITGGGGCQIAVFVAGKCPGNRKLAWAPNEDAESGREIAIETRGEGGYVVLPFSIHPSGNHYRPNGHFGGSWPNIPVISQEVLHILQNGATGTCEAPLSRQQIEKRKKREEQRRKRFEQQANRPRSERIGGPSIIDMVNDEYNIEEVLKRCGYTEELSGRWSRPGAKSGSGVKVFHSDNRSYHHSTNDPMSDGHAKTPFNLLCYYEYNDDVSDAVKGLAEELKLDYASKREEERKLAPYEAARAAEAHSTPIKPKQDNNVNSAVERANAAIPAETEPQEPSGDRYDLAPEEEAALEALKVKVTARRWHEEEMTRHAQKNGYELHPPPPPRQPQPLPSGHDLDQHERKEYEDLPFLEDVNAAFDQLHMDGYENMRSQEELHEFDSQAAEGLQPPNPYPNIGPIEIPPDKHLSDIAPPMNELAPLVVLTSTTGSGKSTWLASFPKTVIHVPTQALALSMALDLGVPAVWEETDWHSKMMAHANVYVCVYDSAYKLAQWLRDGGEDLNEWTSAIDEAHHLILDANPKYRLRAIHSLINSSKNYGRVILTTATYPEIGVPGFERAQWLVYFKRRDPIKILLIHGDSAWRATQFLLKCGNDKIIVHQNNKKTSKVEVEALGKVGITAQMFNADTKKEDHHEQILSDGAIAHYCQALFTTTIYNDGISLRNKEPYCVLVSQESSLIAEEVEQVSNRIRKNPPRQIVLLRNQIDTAQVDFYFDRRLGKKREYAQSQLETAKKVLDGLQELNKIAKTKNDKELFEESLKIIQQNSHYLTIKKQPDGQFVVEIDEFWLRNSVMEEYRAVCEKHVGLLVQKLERRFGFEWDGNIITGLDTHVTEDEKVARQLVRDQEKQNRKEEYQEAIEFLAESKNDVIAKLVAEDLAKDRADLPATSNHKTIARTALKMNNAGINALSAVKILEREKPKSPRALTQVLKKAHRCRLRYLIEEDLRGTLLHISKNPIIRHQWTLMSAFKIGDELTPDRVASAFDLIDKLDPFPKEEKKLSEKQRHEKRMKQIGLCYEVGRKKKTVQVEVVEEVDGQEIVKVKKKKVKVPFIKGLYPLKGIVWEGEAAQTAQTDQAKKDQAEQIEQQIDYVAKQIEFEF